MLLLVRFANSTRGSFPDPPAPLVSVPPMEVTP
jgi:hypothetical protein